jgi:DNA invertase Pin-like site-specific DNA recombinase
VTIPQEQSITKAFAYLRVSGLGQVDGDGFERQLSTINRYAAENGIEIVQVFREEGVSGTTDLENRKALPQLLRALEENGVKTFLIEKLDRLARDLMVQENLIADMRGRGVNLISALEPDLCSTDPSRVLMRQIFGAIAQYDKAMIVLKLKAGLDRKRELTGKAQGPHLYGEKPGENEILAVMREERERGMTFQAIADGLNARGSLARSGKPWTVGAVHKILSRS